MLVTLRTLRIRFGLTLVGFSVLLPTASAQPPESASDANVRQEDREQTMKEMRAEAESIKIFLSAKSDQTSELQLREQPLFRHDSPTRLYADGSLWVWMDAGRPVAFAKIFLPAAPGNDCWVWSSATTDPVEAVRRGAREWYPREGGITFHELPGAPSPAKSDALRMRQMKQFVRRFGGHEFWRPDRTRQELRLMPQPVLRYTVPDKLVFDGAVFIMAHETEPECILMLEAAKKDGHEIWQYGALAIGSAEFHIDLDGKEFYTRAWAKNDLGLPTESYYVLVSPRRK
jgi:hypothetical protein